MGLAVFKNKRKSKALQAADFASYEARIRMEAERRYQLERAYVIAGLHNSKQNDLTIN